MSRRSRTWLKYSRTRFIHGFLILLEVAVERTQPIVVPVSEYSVWIKPFEFYRKKYNLHWFERFRTWWMFMTIFYLLISGVLLPLALSERLRTSTGAIYSSDRTPIAARCFWTAHPEKQLLKNTYEETKSVTIVVNSSARPYTQLISFNIERSANDNLVGNEKQI